MKSCSLLALLLVGFRVLSADVGPVLSTNVITLQLAGDNHVGCSTCGVLNPSKFQGGALAIPAIYHPFHLGGLPYTPETEKWEITQKFRRETATFNWRGQTATIINDVFLEGITNRWKFNAAWTKE